MLLQEQIEGTGRPPWEGAQDRPDRTMPYDRGPIESLTSLPKPISPYPYSSPSWSRQREVQPSPRAAFGDSVFQLSLWRYYYTGV
jgi:hypothetical protein